MAMFASLPTLGQLPVNVRALVAVGLVGVLGIGGYLGLLAPKLREVNTLKAQLARETEAARPQQRVPSVAPITEVERKLWAELETRLRGRYPTEPALPKAVGVLADLARSSGMEIVSLEIQTPPTSQTRLGAEPGKAAPSLPFRPPPEFAVNPSTIKLVARHRYRDLVQLLEGLGRLPVYVAVQSVEVKRVENRLTIEASFASLRWGK